MKELEKKYIVTASGFLEWIKHLYNNLTGRRLFIATGSSQAEVDEERENGDAGGGAAGNRWYILDSASFFLRTVVNEDSFIW